MAQSKNDWSKKQQFFLGIKKYESCFDIVSAKWSAKPVDCKWMSFKNTT
jgi:hypothetical protein